MSQRNESTIKGLTTQTSKDQDTVVQRADRIKTAEDNRLTLKNIQSNKETPNC